jgi:hypothetical protein
MYTCARLCTYEDELQKQALPNDNCAQMVAEIQNKYTRIDTQIHTHTHLLRIQIQLKTLRTQLAAQMQNNARELKSHETQKETSSVALKKTIAGAGLLYVCVCLCVHI